MTNILEQLQKVKIASKTISNLSLNKRNFLIKEIALVLDKNRKSIIKENKKDLDKISENYLLKDRLLLNDKRINSMINSCYELIKINDPLKKYDIEKTYVTKEKIKIKKVSIPLWVVACIYESRPNVTIDLIVMCLKSSNAIILKWWKEAENTNKILIKLTKEVLKSNNLDENVIYNFPINRKDIVYLYNAVWLVDVIIPRWWKNLIEAVRKKSLVPIIETWAWVVHLYLDKEIWNKFDDAIKIIINAKVNRPTVCNSLDTLIINKKINKTLINKLFKKLTDVWVNIIDEVSNPNYHKEHLSLNLNIKYVNNTEEAIKHIEKYSSNHSDWIISINKNNINIFYKSIDSSVVYANTSTRFSDWWCFWFAWEIWIWTQKLHARWPIWVDALVTYKYLVESDFRVRN